MDRRERKEGRRRKEEGRRRRRDKENFQVGRSRNKSRDLLIDEKEERKRRKIDHDYPLVPKNE